MKKISLKNLNFKEVEQLSRQQLKDVMGGVQGSGNSCNTHSTSSCGGSCTTSIGTPGKCDTVSINGAVICGCYES